MTSHDDLRRRLNLFPATAVFSAEEVALLMDEIDRLREVREAVKAWDAHVKRKIEIHAGRDEPMGSWAQSAENVRKSAWALRQALAALQSTREPSTKPRCPACGGPMSLPYGCDCERD